MLWSAFALNFHKSTFEVPNVVMSAIEPMQHFLVSNDIEAAQLTPRDDDESKATSNAGGNLSRTNMIVIQVIDKILFVIFLFLAIVLHN